jgi:hypothetical protein
MARHKQGKVDLRCNNCDHQFRGWVWYSEIPRVDPGARSLYPGESSATAPSATLRQSATSSLQRWTTPHRTRARPPEMPTFTPRWAWAR